VEESQPDTAVIGPRCEPGETGFRTLTTAAAQALGVGRGARAGRPLYEDPSHGATAARVPETPSCCFRTTLGPEALLQGLIGIEDGSLGRWRGRALGSLDRSISIC